MPFGRAHIPGFQTKSSCSRSRISVSWHVNIRRQLGMRWRTALPMAAPRRFRIVAIGFGLGAFAHAAEVVASLFGHTGRDYPLWRHGVFVAIDGGLAVLAIAGPRWLWLPLLLLLGQQITTHGRDIVQTWRAGHAVSWLSLAPMTFVIASALLAIEYRWQAHAIDEIDAPRR